MQDGIKNLFQPDVLAPSRFLEAHRSKNTEPEKALMFAVLSDAIDTFQKFAFSSEATTRRLFGETESWIWEEESDYLFSFGNICEVVGLDPASLRRGLENWAAKRRNAGCRQSRRISRLKAAIDRGMARRQRPLLVRRRMPRVKGGWFT